MTDNTASNVVDAIKPAERAYLGIRQAILSGELPGGAHLREEALAVLTGTSRTPVRHALQRIVAEGLARADGCHRFVADFSFGEVMIMFELRARLESYAARIAASNASEGDFQTLEGIIAEIDRLDLEAADANLAANKDIFVAFQELNSRFHACVIESTGSVQMTSLSQQAVALPLELIKQIVWSQKVNIRRSNEQHKDILAALRARNPDWAEAAMAGHILSTKPRKREVGSDA